jgi:hypothetical protein
MEIVRFQKTLIALTALLAFSVQVVGRPKDRPMTEREVIDIAIECSKENGRDISEYRGGVRILMEYHPRKLVWKVSFSALEQAGEEKRWVNWWVFVDKRTRKAEFIGANEQSETNRSSDLEHEPVLAERSR